MADIDTNEDYGVGFLYKAMREYSKTSKFIATQVDSRSKSRNRRSRSNSTQNRSRLTWNINMSVTCKEQPSVCMSLKERRTVKRRGYCHWC